MAAAGAPDELPQAAAAAAVGADAGAAADPKPEVVHPEPPYTEASSLEGGLACYYDGCKYKGSAWGLLLDHVRVGHKRKLKDMKQDCFLLKKGREDLNATRKGCYRAGPKTPSTGGGGAVGKANKKAALDAPPQARRKRAAPDLAPIAAASGSSAAPAAAEPEKDRKIRKITEWMESATDDQLEHMLQFVDSGTNAAAPRVEANVAAAPRQQSAPAAGHVPGAGVSPGGPEQSGGVVLKINANALTWSPEGRKPGSNFPPMIAEEFEIDGRFETWLGQQRLLNKKKSVGPTVVAIKRLLGIIQVVNVGRNDPELLQAMYRQDFLAQIIELGLFNIELSWTRKEATALAHWCEFKMACCNRERKADLHADILALRSEIVAWSKACQAAKKRQNKARYKKDAERTSRMATPEDMKAGAVKAMLNLRRLHNKYAGSDTMPNAEFGQATRDLAGVAYTCGWAGRDQEWKELCRLYS
jgi:hypothetical protein